MTPDESSLTDGDSSESGGDRLEDAIMVASALLLVGVLAYLVTQALVAPAAPSPTATVDAVEPLASGGNQTGSVRVTVSLENEGETGLRSVEVLVQCGATERSLVFAHVPARGNRTGTAVCPRGTRPTASVATWIEA